MVIDIVATARSPPQEQTLVGLGGNWIRWVRLLCARERGKKRHENSGRAGPSRTGDNLLFGDEDAAINVEKSIKQLQY